MKFPKEVFFDKIQRTVMGYPVKGIGVDITILKYLDFIEMFDYTPYKYTPLNKPLVMRSFLAKKIQEAGVMTDKDLRKLEEYNNEISKTIGV